MENKSDLNIMNDNRISNLFWDVHGYLGGVLESRINEVRQFFLGILLTLNLDQFCVEYFHEIILITRSLQSILHNSEHFFKKTRQKNENLCDNSLK